MKIDTLKAELSAKGSELASWRQLVESPAWAWFKKTMEQQRTSRLFLVAETPLESFGGALGQEFMKGEGAGIGLTLMFPYTQIELLTLDTKRLSTEIEMESDHVQKTSAVAGAGDPSRVDDSTFCSDE